ncbi:MAG: YggT family protein [Myxococcota bacterium]
MEFVVFVLQGLGWLVIVDAVASWVVPDPRSFPRNVTSPLLDPMYAPIRAILKPSMTGGIDFSPMILILAFNALARGIASSGLAL